MLWNILASEPGARMPRAVWLRSLCELFCSKSPSRANKKILRLRLSTDPGDDDDGDGNGDNRHGDGDDGAKDFFEI